MMLDESKADPDIVAKSYTLSKDELRKKLIELDVLKERNILLMFSSSNEEDANNLAEELKLHGLSNIMVFEHPINKGSWSAGGLIRSTVHKITEPEMTKLFSQIASKYNSRYGGSDLGFNDP